LRLILGAVVGAVQMLGASAPHVRRTGLELGGKGALIVLEDAPMTALVDWAMMGIFMTSGQVCCATSRLLVHVSRKDEVLEALRASAAAVRMGDPLDETTQMGAVITEEAALRLVGAVAQARAEGSILVCGGGRVAAGALPAALAGGYYVQPTVLADVPRSSSAWQVIALDCPRLPLIALDCLR
jgi:acyl-CoA reductase-like NAD-dependent aldehyde dehydrogenase